jgi:hypothetical protein
VIERVETIRGRFLKWGIGFTAEAQRTQRKRGEASYLRALREEGALPASVAGTVDFCDEI